MDLAAKNAEAIAALRKRCYDARTTPRKLCDRAGVAYTTFWRAEKNPAGITIDKLDKLETEMTRIEREREAA